MNQIAQRLLRKSTQAGKVALITGGSSGIGKSCALEMAKQGARVVITDLANREKQMQQVVEEITKMKGQAMYIPLDVSKEKDWTQAIQQVHQKWNEPLDVLVNNAGIGGALKPFEELTLEDFRLVQSINLDGVFLGMREGVKSMKQNPLGGSIINVSSILGFVGNPIAVPYCTSKGGVRLMTKATALYCAQNKMNIRVNSIHPGYIDTPILDGIRQTPGVLENLISLHPIGRLGKVEEVASGVVYFASDESSFITGTELLIDGGYTAQ